MKEQLKELSVREIFGFTLAFVTSIAFIAFLLVLTYGMAKHFNLI